MPHAALARASPAPPIKSSKPAYARRLLIGWLIIVALITVGTAIFYQSQAVDLRQQAEADMTTIAKLKVNQIESWLADLYADAGTLAANPDFLAQVSACLLYTSDAADE